MTIVLPRRSLEITAATLAFAAGSLVGLTSGCSSPAAAAPPERAATPVNADTVVAEARAVPLSIALTGTLLAAREADVAAEGSGRVVAVLGDRGDSVEAGTPLARLDARAASLARREAGASAAGVVAERANAELECARAERLFASKVISRAEYDRTTASCATTTHSADAALARAGLAAKTLSDAVIRAPFPGVIAERNVEVGDYVNPGGKIMTIVDVSTLKLEVAVPETAVPSVAVGRTVTFAVAAYPEREFTGTVKRLSPSLRLVSRDQVIEVSVDNAEGALRPGMFATARLETGETRFPVVPQTAVLGRAPSEHLFVVGPGSKVEERVIATGDRVGVGIAVVRGVAPGERVIAKPHAAVRDGVVVHVVQ